MDYPVRVEVRVGEGGAGLDELQRAGAASLLGDALSVASGPGQPGGPAAALAGFGVSTHAQGARLTLSLDATGRQAAEHAARQIVARVLSDNEALTGWRVTECRADPGDGPAPQSVIAAADREPAARWPGWSEIRQARARMAADAPRLRAFGLEAFGYAADQDGGGVSREAAELAAGALVHSIGPMLDTLFDDAELLRSAATTADRCDPVVLDGLPPRFADRYDSCFARRFLVAAVSVTGRLTRPGWEPPACVAEELALRLLIDWAEASLEEFHLVGARERQAAYRGFAALALGDAGHGPLFEGVARWFEPLGEHRPVHAYAGAQNVVAALTGDDAGDPARETELIGAMLAGRLGIDPGRLGPLADLLAIGLVHDGWRNRRVQQWRASGRLTDADLLRIDSHLTHRAQEHIRTWAAGHGLSVDGPAEQLDGPAAADVEDLAGGLLGLLTNPARRLPSGGTLAGLAGDELGEYEREAALALDRFVAQAQASGLRHAVVRSAGRGGLSCPHWWSHPAWPAIVGRFVAVLDDPASDHWGPGGGWRRQLPPEPDMVADRDELRRILLASPWELSTGAAEWVTAAGFGLLRQPV
jgi:hypothetical protein